MGLKLTSNKTSEKIDYSVWEPQDNEAKVILLADDIKKIDKITKQIKSLALSRNARDSSFRLHKISHLQLNISKYKPLKGGKYRTFLTEILRKQAVSLIEECDKSNCLKLSIKKYFKDKNIEKVVNFDNIPCPTPLSEMCLKQIK